jgi:hypothetical protein
MKKAYFFFAVFALISLGVFAQSNVKVGDTFIINEVSSDNYKYIKFPKSSTVIKKGGVADYKHIVGKKVEVTSLKEKKDGTTIATIKLASGKQFFKSHRYVTVNIAKAIENKELQ